MRRGSSISSSAATVQSIAIPDSNNTKCTKTTHCEECPTEAQENSTGEEKEL